MGHDGLNGGAKGMAAGFGGLVNGINIRTISEGGFAAMGVADEFSNDALEDLFLIGH